VAVLRAEAALAGGARATVELAAREARRFGPAVVARQLADRLAAAAAGPPQGFTGRDRGELVLAPAVGARLLAALVPLLVGAAAARRMAPLRDRRGRVASPRLTVVDDGRLAGGMLAAPVDGEGMPTRTVTLIEAGLFRQPLVSWRGARDLGEPHVRPSGCERRASWRDVPSPAPTHLQIVPDPAVPPADLLAALARGYYLLDTAGEPTVDWRDGTFRVPVLGFSVQSGRARAPIAGVWLTGTLRALLSGVQSAARDLTFFPYDGMIGSPSLLVSGLELRARP
jgi:PmbA protein